MKAGMATAPGIVRHSSLGSLGVRRLTVNIGAEISGPDLGDIARDDDLFAEVKALWLAHKVLFFRDQDITRGDHEAFAKRFGEVEGHPMARSDPYHPGIIQIHHEQTPPQENTWHCDGTFRDTPPKAAVLRCLQTPDVGGDTLWANMAKAYEDLPADIKVRISNLYARHSFEHTFGADLPIDERHAWHEKFPPAEHPVVVTHPETQEKVLYVSSFTTHFTNFRKAAADRYGLDFVPYAGELLNFLMLRASIPEYQVRWKWTPNSVAFWDNRCTQHLAVQDYWPAPRRMERATIVGERPR